MIIDLTGSSLRSPMLEADSISVEEFNFDWEAHNEWTEYRDEKMGSQPHSRKLAIDVVRTALLDDHMRGILRRATCREIQSEVAEIIDSWERAVYNHFIKTGTVMALACRSPQQTLRVETAATRIVELDYQEKRRSALAKENDKWDIL